ncbi:hypothetical protein [Actinoallomurus rhizosphaericola]|uniref:hypothetical protein n=1 Tax=Actinoallomurus rhizosphaericola TaxID=2952536 RepID=UPI002090492D|nr:hypothetical protein [Actinoallomurus rhizosphaericola]MCO5992726.1 hypothetical protein [Actinoallomurus rhizosphaericola]
MDPLSVSALVTLLSKIFDGATGKVGEQLWDDLTSVVRRVFGRRSTSVEAAKRLGERPGDLDATRALAEALIADSARDPQGAAQIRHWVARAEHALAAEGSVTNTIDGSVTGNVVQARDIRGDITF